MTQHDYLHNVKASTSATVACYITSAFKPVPRLSQVKTTPASPVNEFSNVSHVNPEAEGAAYA